MSRPLLARTAKSTLVPERVDRACSGWGPHAGTRSGGWGQRGWGMVEDEGNILRYECRGQGIWEHEQE